MNRQRTAFIKTVSDFYQKNGRHELPWRKTRDPYAIAVSEIMLQQTQVDRVVPKYHAFLKLFPTPQALAIAPLATVLKAWSGLGYNRRAKYLQRMAQQIVTDCKGVFPRTVQSLRTLPGIGAYTAGAIVVFAYNMPEVFIETNIRTVFIHHFFRKQISVSDMELLPIITDTLDRTNPREWYAALMDYGSFLKAAGNTVHRNSTTYLKQSTFKNSRRQVRGMVLRELLKKPLSIAQLLIRTEKDREYLTAILIELEKEGFIIKEKGMYTIAAS